MSNNSVRIARFSGLNATLIFALVVSATANFLAVAQSQMITSLAITLTTAVTAIVVSWLVSKVRS